MSANTPENLEYLTPTLIRYWLFDGRVVVFKPIGTTRETVDAWFQVATETAQHWPSDRLYLELHDMRQTTVTPYSRQKAGELVKFLSSKQGRAAIVIANTRLGEIMRFIVDRVMSRTRQTIQRRTFTSMEAAITWLFEAID